MKNKILFPLLFICISGLAIFALPFDHAHGQSESIAVVVNDGAISASDLNDRMTLVMRSSGLRPTDEMRARVMPQILNVLIDEELKLQEAKRLGIEVTQEEIDTGFAQVANQNNFEPEQFKAMMKRGGINIQTMYRQIRSQVGWTKVVQQQIRPQIQVSENDIQAALKRLESNLGKTEYRVAEIFLPFENREEQKDVQQLANRLRGEIQSGQAPFPQVAQQFSKSAGAGKGGDLGWVQEGQLDEALERALKNMEVRSVSKPVRTVSGFHILLLLDKRQITEDNLPGRAAVMNQIGTERLERMQRKYLMDLKANAFIDNRV